MRDYKFPADVEEFIGEGCPFDAPHTNVFCELFGKVVSLIASDDCVKEGLISCDIQHTCCRWVRALCVYAVVQAAKQASGTTSGIQDKVSVAVFSLPWIYVME